MKTITICMGSSCFSRGNAANAEVIQRFLVENGLQEKVTLRGCLCESECKNGPNVRIDGKLYTNMTPESLIDLLTLELGFDK